MITEAVVGVLVVAIAVGLLIPGLLEIALSKEALERVAGVEGGRQTGVASTEIAILACGSSDTGAGDLLAVESDSVLAIPEDGEGIGVGIGEIDVIILDVVRAEGKIGFVAIALGNSRNQGLIVVIVVASAPFSTQKESSRKPGLLLIEENKIVLKPFQEVNRRLRRSNGFGVNSPACRISLRLGNLVFGVSVDVGFVVTPLIKKKEPFATIGGPRPTSANILSRQPGDAPHHLALLGFLDDDGGCRVN